MLATFLAVGLLFTGPLAARAQPSIPEFWNTGERLPKPDLSAMARLRFLTTTDFPPFTFTDAAGRLTGFNVDLARAICAVLEMRDRCQIEALPWDELDRALSQGGGEAIVAGLAVTAETRQSHAFSRTYLQFPARFVALRDKATDKGADKEADEPLYDRLAGMRVGVVAGTAHERMLRDLFPALKVVTYTRQAWLFDDLKAGKIEAAFGDGMRLGFWLAGSASQDCCAFAGGPYLAPEYLGQGLAIAVPRDRPELARAFDYALQEIGVRGTFAELYLRYFPVSFY